MGDEKEAGVELLTEDHCLAKNLAGQPVVGWLPTSDGVGGLFNLRGWAFLRVVLWKLANGARVWLYDQPVIVENPGAIVIAQVGDRVGLVRNYRMVGPRIPVKNPGDYVRCLNEGRLWNWLLGTLGAWKWEAPRGLTADPNAEPDLERFILKVAKAEALEEAGFAVSEARIVGMVNANSSFYIHPQWVVHARITARGSANPEELEILGQARLFTREELRAMNKTGEFDDGLTLAAMAMCGLSL